LPRITVTVRTYAWLSDGHAHAMTIADYIAFGVLIGLALSAIAGLYQRGKDTLFEEIGGLGAHRRARQ
jgi:hypothetical protein